MSRDILSEYGRDAYKPQASPLSSGGIMPVRDVMNYEPPAGPINQMGHQPGLPGGASLGQGQKFTHGDTIIGSSGLHGHNYGNCGSQGRR